MIRLIEKSFLKFLKNFEFLYYIIKLRINAAKFNTPLIVENKILYLSTVIIVVDTHFVKVDLFFLIFPLYNHERNDN